jgi:hypothetical protein
MVNKMRTGERPPTEAGYTFALLGPKRTVTVPTASATRAMKILPDQFGSTRMLKSCGGAGGDNIEACPSPMVKPSVG